MLRSAAAFSTLKVFKPGGLHMLEKTVLQEAVGFDDLCVTILVRHFL